MKKLLVFLFLLGACAGEDVAPKKISTPENLTGRWSFGDANPDVPFSGEFDMTQRNDSLITSNGTLTISGKTYTLVKARVHKDSFTKIYLETQKYNGLIYQALFSEIVIATDFNKVTGKLMLANDGSFKFVPNKAVDLVRLNK